MAGNNQRGNITGTGKEELQYMRFQNLTTAPVSGTKGQFYYDTVFKLLGIYDTSWTYLPKSYLDLHDTTDTTYTAKAGFVPMVNALQTGIELVGSELATFDILADTPVSKVGYINKLLKVNSAATLIEYSSVSETGGILTTPFITLSSGTASKYYGTDINKNLVPMVDPDTFWKRTSLLIEPRVSGNTLRVVSTTATAITGSSTSLFGISGFSSTYIGIIGASTSDIGVYGTSVNSYGGFFQTNTTASPNLVTGGLKIGRTTNLGKAAITAGFGTTLSFDMPCPNYQTNITGQIINKWTNVTIAGEFSSFEWWLQDTGSLTKKMELKGSGQLLLSNYGSGTFTGTQTRTLQVDSSGNIIEGTIRCTKTENLGISLVEVTIAGSTFTPPITSEPRLFSITEVIGGTTIVQHNVIDRCELNGGYYNVIITPLETVIPVAKISVFI